MSLFIRHLRILTFYVLHRLIHLLPQIPPTLSLQTASQTLHPSSSLLLSFPPRGSFLFPNGTKYSPHQFLSSIVGEPTSRPSSAAKWKELVNEQPVPKDVHLELLFHPILSPSKPPSSRPNATSYAPPSTYKAAP
ncbi:LOW QUALITY PROTEIN: hypothetical protein RTBOTA2_005358 [Rhodotorula toruloides]|nr:LOW QUALITY PROTEIN: hypothetical protein RTBOTA2_005358 [Rhodotorula toruloides]